MNDTNRVEWECRSYRRHIVLVDRAVKGKVAGYSRVVGRLNFNEFKTLTWSLENMHTRLSVLS